jgi:endonuclease-3
MPASNSQSNERLLHIIQLLKAEYPQAKCSLDFSNPLELLIATILSAQCTDERVNRVTRDLFKKYPSALDYAQASQQELEQDIRSTGFYKNKAKNIISCCKSLVQKHGGQVPASLEELTQLGGVGRKTANVVLGSYFGIPAMVVDTHVSRITQRLGLTSQKDPVKIEFELMQQVPQADWVVFSHMLILHGRKVCKARNPLHDCCCINTLCPSCQA